MRECLWKYEGGLCMIECNIGVRVDWNGFFVG